MISLQNDYFVETAFVIEIDGKLFQILFLSMNDHRFHYRSDRYSPSIVIFPKVANEEHLPHVEPRESWMVQEPRLSL